MKEFVIRITPMGSEVRKVEVVVKHDDGSSLLSLHVLGSNLTALSTAFDELRKMESEDPVCAYCRGTGELSMDERNADGNWERGVGTRKCICQLKN